jgi:hypothetical protein
MENYDNLFEQQPEQTEQPFDREAWAQQKREQRQELYDLIEEMSEKTLADPSALSDYLNMQARLGKTSVANTLLVVAQKPDATFIANYDDWQKRGRSVKRGEKGALVLEANGEYERPDGTMGVNFDVKRVFDISQTYGKPVRERTAPPIKTALKAITTNVPVPVKLSEGVSQSVGAMYSKMDNTVYVARGVEGNELFFALSRELARAHSGADTFVCDCAANIACLRYGVPAKYCDRIPDEIAALESREKRSALNTVRDAACEITERVDRNLFAERQQSRNDPVR